MGTWNIWIRAKGSAMDVRPPKRRCLSPPGDEMQANGTEYTSTGSDTGDKSEADNHNSKGHYISTQDSHASRQPTERSRNHSEEDTRNLREPLQLQAHELLRSITPRYSNILSLAHKTIHRVRDAFETAESIGPFPVTAAKTAFLKQHGVAVPFPEPLPDPEANHRFSYAKPESIELVGELSQEIAVDTDGIYWVDLIVRMPASLLTAKDYLDYRYFHKRAFYLAGLTASISHAFKDEISLEYQWRDENPLLPILVIGPPANENQSSFARSKCRIRVSPCVTEGAVFPHDKLQTASQSIRSMRPLPTPFYNATLAQEAAIMLSFGTVRKAAELCHGFKDACKLGSVWLRQRAFDSALSKGGFGTYEWSILLAKRLLGAADMKAPAIPSTLDALQLFKAMLQWLAFHDFGRPPTELLPQRSPLISASPLLFCSVLNLNLLYRMTAWSYGQLKSDARSSIRALNHDPSGAFAGCFIYKVDEPLLRHDCMMTLPTNRLVACVQGPSDEPHLLFVSNRLHKLLIEGLNDRITDLHILMPSTMIRAIDKPRSIRQKDTSIEIAVTIQPTSVLRRVDRGPPPEDTKDSAAFKTLWDDKAELRKFNDGSIRYAVAWNSDNHRDLLCEMVRHLLTVHFDTTVATSLEIKVDTSDGLLDCPNPNLGAFDPVMATFEHLQNDLRSMRDFPLQIRQSRPASAVLSFTSLLVPSSKSQACNQVIDATVQFEGSSKWPDNFAAAQITKVAFLLKMRDLLQEVSPQAVTRVGLENQGSRYLNRCFLAITYSNNITFHLRIHHEREQTLLERQLKDKNSGPAERGSVATALATYRRNFERRPAHVGAMQLLARRQPALSPATRLLKAWFDAHLLQSHVPEELIEMVAAHVFVSPHPWKAPTTALTGFLRALLFLSVWDWQRDPLIVDLGGGLRKDNIESLHTRFEAWRKLDPAMNRLAVFAATDYDLDGATWTEQGPSRVVADRVTALAKAASDLIRKEGSNLDVHRLFKPTLKNFDFVIYLSERRAAKQQTSRHDDFTGLYHGNLAAVYLRDLQSTFGEAISFFADLEKRNIIAGVCHPNTGRRAWKATLPYSTAAIGDTHGQVTVEKEATLAEMARLGGDMVRSVLLRG